MADRWLSWFLLIFFGAFFLVGCIPKSTSKFLTEHSYLSAWIQAIGSLAAVWSALWIYYRNSSDNLQKEKKEEIKRSQEKKEKEILENDKKVLLAKAEFLSNNHLSEFFIDLDFFLKSSKNSVEGDLFALDLNSQNSISKFLKLNQYLIKPLRNEDFKKLCDIFGDKAISIQQSLIRIKGISIEILKLQKYKDRSDQYYQNNITSEAYLTTKEFIESLMIININKYVDEIKNLHDAAEYFIIYLENK